MKVNFEFKIFEENLMFTSNHFAELSASIPTAVMQGYIVLMVLLVIVGTILDMMHKKSAKYFFANAEKAKKSAKRSVGAGEKASIAASAAVKPRSVRCKCEGGVF